MTPATAFNCPNCDHRLYPVNGPVLGLTRMQSRVLTAIARQLAAGSPSPTLREIAAGMDRRSCSGVQGHVRALVKKGLVTHAPRRFRSIALTDDGWKAFISAGSPHA